MQALRLLRRIPQRVLLSQHRLATGLESTLQIHRFRRLIMQRFRCRSLPSFRFVQLIFQRRPVLRRTLLQLRQLLTTTVQRVLQNGQFLLQIGLRLLSTQRPRFAVALGNGKLAGQAVGALLGPGK